jgi:hypothetical protein
VARRSEGSTTLLGPIDHRPSGSNLIISSCRRGFDIDDNRILGIDQIIEPVAELHAFVGFRCPRRAGVAQRDHLRWLAIGIAFSVLYGFWVANLVAFNSDVCGDLATQFLSLAEKQGATVPLMVGHQILGISLQSTGDIAAGRAHYDQAIALYDPAEHRRLATRFGQDSRVVVLSRRSAALWLLGHPEASLADAEHALRDARDIGHALGLTTANGLVFTTAFYWDRDEASRAWSKRFFERTGRMPGMVQAGTYSAVLHYLKAMEAAGTSDGKVVADKIRELPVDDFFAKGRVREDGRMMHDMYLVEVKTPSESKAKWDYYKVLRRIPAEEAAQRLSESKCSLVKK